MNYTLLVTGPPYGTQNSMSAFLFARALIFNCQHKLSNIFFYCEGVLNSNEFFSPDFNEYNLVNEWALLHKHHLVKLCVCISAALRRGIIDKKNSNLNNKNVYMGNKKSSFSLVGLSEFSDYIESSDRIIQF